ncbi:major facilitator superfamily domain-containing protein [Umbelopsis sp. AD052]|nr:major facilitator superfamily domain-containing protein [Umbelopsis sp. AD052]
MLLDNAKGHDMQTVAHLTGTQVSLGVALFYVGLVLFELPSNLIITKVRASGWLARIMISWGIVTTLMVVIRNEASYYVLRFFLGAMEAGLWPGMAMVVSKFYKKSETGIRMGLYFFSAAVALIVSGFFSAAFQLIDGRGNLYGWQWLFLVFGLLTVIIGVFFNFWLPSTPFEKKGWLTEEEKEIARHRIALDRPDLEDRPKITIRAVIKELMDYKVYLFTIIYMCTVLISTSIQYYSQTMIIQMGYTSINVSLMNIPVGVMIATGLSDHFKTRSLPFMASMLIAAAGFAIVAFTHSNAARYAAFGMGPGVPLSMSWATNSKDKELPLAISLALISALAQLGTIFSTFFLYAGWPSDAPKFTGSNSVNIALILRLDLQRLNKQIDRNGSTKDGRTAKYLLAHLYSKRWHN